LGLGRGSQSFKEVGREALLYVGRSLLSEGYTYGVLALAFVVRLKRLRERGKRVTEERGGW
jgi:hypothetical protein